MNEDILNKLHNVLSKDFPDQESREEIITAMGEVIWTESLQKVLEVLSEEKRGEVVSLLNEGKLEEVVAIFDEENIDIDSILEERSQSVLREVLGTH